MTALVFLFIRDIVFLTFVTSYYLLLGKAEIIFFSESKYIVIYIIQISTYSVTTVLT